MDQPVTTTIDPSLCVGCGACVEVCPAETLSLRDGRAVVTGDRSLGCGHCEAVCPEGAITVGELAADASAFATFEIDRTWLAPGEVDPAELVRLMASRRSCRRYTVEPLSRAVLEDLVRIGATAPSGTNSQRWLFTILPTRSAVVALATKVAGFFELLNRASESRAVRLASRALPIPNLDAYYADHHDRIREALEDWKLRGRDRLFHGAPAAILVGSRPGASTGGEDALLASQNILLGAHALGLGSCLIGYAVAAIRGDPRIRGALGLARGERIHAVVALGTPDERYERTAGRKRIDIRIFEG